MSAIADQISLQLADEKGQYASAAPGNAIQTGMAAGAQAHSAFKAQNQEEAANAFQTVLNGGYKTMVQAFNEADPETKLLSGDPAMYQTNEDTMASWWAKYAAAKQKVELKQAARQAADLQSQGKTEEAQKLLTSSGAVTPEVGVEGMQKAKDKNEQDARGKELQDIFAGIDTSGATSTISGDAGLSDAKSPFAKQFKITSKRVEDWAPHIEKASLESGVPASIIKAIISVESAGKPNAISSSGAKGPMQLLDSTAKDMGVIDSQDPEQNISGGTKYIAQLITKYGDLEKAIAAYNSGPGNVDRLVAKYGGSWKEHLPEETKGYIEDVPKYLKAYGGATVSGGASAEPTQLDVFKKAVAADPKLVTDPGFKEGLSALNADQKNLADKKATIQQDKLNALNASRMQKRVDQLYKDVLPIQNLARSYKDLNDIIPGGVNGSGDIPGIGLGKSLVRNWLIGTSKDSTVGKIRAKLAEITNVTLRERSGTAVTADEGRRIMNELALTPASTVDDFRYAIQKKIANSAQAYQQALRKDPEAMALYLERNPELEDPFSFTKGPVGASGLNPEQRKARIAELKAKMADQNAANP